MKGSYLSVVLLVILFGVLATMFVNNVAQDRSYSRLQYEYETLKGYLDIEPELLNEMLYSTGGIGRLSFVNAFDVDGVTYIVLKNTGDVALSGFAIESEGFDIATIIKPDILLPGSEGVLAAYAGSIAKPGTLTVRTKQNAAVLIKLA